MFHYAQTRAINHALLWDLNSGLPFSLLHTDRHVWNITTLNPSQESLEIHREPLLNCRERYLSEFISKAVTLG